MIVVDEKYGVAMQKRQAEVVPELKEQLEATMTDSDESAARRAAALTLAIRLHHEKDL